MGNEISKRNDGNSYSFTRAVDDAIRSNTSSILGSSPVRSFGSLIDSAIRTSTASTTDAENFEITPPPEQQAQAQQPLLQTAETINAVTPPLLPLNTGFTSTSVSGSAYDTNSNSRNSSASIFVTSRSEGEILQSPNLKSFSYNLLRTVTRNLRPDRVFGEGGFGPVFKCCVAVKRLKHDGFQDHREWLLPLRYIPKNLTFENMKQEIVIKVHMNCQKCRAKALKVVASANGVNFVGLEGEEKDNLVVIGDGVDAVKLTNSLRKKVGQTQIISVADHVN